MTAGDVDLGWLEWAAERVAAGAHVLDDLEGEQVYCYRRERARHDVVRVAVTEFLKAESRLVATGIRRLRKGTTKASAPPTAGAA